MTTHKVRFQPVNIEIEANEDETVLDAAFRQGILLMHGCREGQCSACKSLLLDGDLEMGKYSTFALPDFERDEGYVLLCRGKAYSDLDVELLNYDEETIQSGILIQKLQTAVEEIEPLTHDIRRLRLKIVEGERMVFNAGQYVDIYIPGSDEHRAFSMANTPATSDETGTEDYLEFIIKLYPGGLFSSLLESGLKIGDRLELKGPYGSFMLRETSNSDLLFIGGGSGMAPLWSMLNHMAERGIQRKVTFYYGARTRKDLFYLDRLQQLAERLPGFRFVPALSEPRPEDKWEGETGFISDVIDRSLAPGQTELEAYLCGPPPMIDAAMAVLFRKGVSEGGIFFDKFTPAGEVEEAGAFTQFTV